MTNELIKTFSGRKASQIKFEIESFAALLRSYDVRSLLEIGSREGDTFHFLMTSLPLGSVGVAVDLPGGAWGKRTTGTQLERAINDLITRGYLTSFILGDSKNAQIVRNAKLRGPFDAVFIDGDHRYEGVKADWETYRHFAPIVAFHDIVGTGQIDKTRGHEVEVPRLWEEIKASGLRVREFIAPGSAMGIGCVLQ